MRFYLLRAQGADSLLVYHLHIDGAVDPDRLRAAFTAVVTAQPALRTGLVAVETGIEQLRYPPSAVSITVHEDDPVPPDLAGAAAALRRGLGEDGPWCRIVAFVRADGTDCLVAVDHANFDEPSAGLLLRQLAAAYYGRTPPEPPTATPTGPSPQRRDRLRAFWTAALDGCPDDTTIPPVAVTADRRPGTVLRPLGPDLAAALAGRTRTTGATPFVQVLAAVAVTAGWYAERDDVVLATPADIRGAAGEGAIGCWQNTLPIRIRTTAPDPADLLARTMDALYDAVEHADLPLEDIITARSPARPPGRRPLTQIICAQSTTSEPVAGSDGLRWHLGPAAGEGVGYDLAVTLEIDGPAAAIRLNYPRAGLPDPVATAFADYLLHVLAWVAGAHAAPHLRGPILSGPEPAGPEPAGSRAAAMPERFAAMVRRQPHATAVDDGTTRLTYAELDRRAATLATALAGAGVRPGDRVGIGLPRTVDMVVAVLAIWRAGAAYVPLDPEYPAERLRHMAVDAGLTALVAFDQVVPGVPVVPPDTPAPPRHTAELGRRGDTAYVIYTSGSTGAPKGVVIRHDNVAALIDAFETLLPGAPGTVVAGTSLSFDISVLELCWPLATGRTVLLTAHRTVAAAAVPDGALYQCTPTVAGLLIADPDGARLLGRLGVLLVGGEPLPDDLAAELTRLVPGPVVNCYGPTETTVWSTAGRVRPGEPVTIGTPLAGETCWVAGRDGRPRPPGTPGRLMIAGSGVGDGYWQRPELTAERFAGGYDTGDIAVVGPDGRLRCLGRADTQVKVLGQRIELEEIEAVLRRHPGVRDAVVTFTGGLLTAHVVRVGDVTAEDLRRQAAALLTGATVPATWAWLDRIPQLPNGKLDRAAVARLAARPAATTTAPSAGAQTERPPTEFAVGAAWADVLGLPVTDPDVTFFELGGSSTTLIQVLARLRPRFPALSAADLFRYPTVRALAAHLSGRSPDDPHTDDRGAARRRALSSWGPRGRKGAAS